MDALRPPPMTAALDDRCTPRLQIKIPATLRASAGRTFQTSICDLTIAGFSASSFNRMNEGAVCWLSLPGLETLQAEVVWWNRSLVGCSFTTMLNPLVYENLIERWRISKPFLPL